ncbi:TetR/AcrR family transcriptional regulator [Acidiferrimicrobium sp. IK]|uniref:TetR/AcrR family transcriptional regulator n=1 Tax=Acidiferrimicrobium sp. IK TaxID=2871700 RepID=UPI0021CB4797|nr:TetR/AcrR family transcriptional regulator [Acidiferrimicrobium sp. IK]MCU4184929.1 TetR/AcrR family transcriptional regulator [Acidiferrimicrobium sp. IK]
MSDASAPHSRARRAATTGAAADGASPARAPGWAGTTIEDRRRARQGRLLDAGLDLMGSGGTAAVTVRSVCRSARLTERYFYESFTDRDAFLLAVYERVALEAQQALAAAVAASPPDPPARARAVVEAFMGIVIDDPRKGRVLLLEAFGDPTLAAAGANLLPSFGALIEDQLPGEAGGRGPLRAMSAVSMVGALAHLFSAWLDGSITPSRRQLVDHAVAVVLAHVALAAG